MTYHIARDSRGWLTRIVDDYEVTYATARGYSQAEAEANARTILASLNKTGEARQ